MLMAYLIIVCPHSGRQPLWVGKAHADPLVGISQGCVRLFFVEMARLRASFRHRKHRDTDRSKHQGRLGQACTVYGCPTSAQVFLSLRETPQVTEGGPCPPLSYPRTFRI